MRQWDDKRRLLTAMRVRTLIAPAPESNWWAMIAESGRLTAIQTPLGEVSGHVVPELARSGHLSVTPLLARRRVLNGDDLDLATHEYAITEAGRTYLASLNERGKA